MPEPLHFISYSRVDGEDFAIKLADQLTAGPPSIGVWPDRRKLQPGIDWDEQLVEALRICAGFHYIMTADSVSPNSQRSPACAIICDGGMAEGVLHALKERPNDARRDLARAHATEKATIEDEIAKLQRQIEQQRNAGEN